MLSYECKGLAWDDFCRASAGIQHGVCRVWYGVCIAFLCEIPLGSMQLLELKLTLASKSA